MARLKKDASATQAPPKKRVKKSESSVAKPARKRRGNTGKLELMLKLPVEVFSEIAGNLSPLDLLHMARANRALRRYLLSKTSRPIWCAALSNYDVPGCYTGWTELRFSRFLFEEECEACGSRTPRVNFELRFRLCRKCEDVNMAGGHHIIRDNFAAEVQDEPEIYALAPYYSLIDLSWEEENDPEFSRRFLGSQFFDEEELIRVVNKFLTFNDGSVEQRRYVTARHVIVKDIMSLARKLRKWAEEYEKRKEKDKKQLCKQREKDVQNRLMALGYSKRQVTTFDHLSHEWHLLVHHPKPLTERTWKNLLPKLQPIMDSRKEKCDRADYRDRVAYRRMEFGDFYKAYLKKANINAGDMRFMPGTEDVMTTPAAKRLIEENGAKEVITQEMWDAALDEEFVQFFEDFKPRAREWLSEAVDKARDKLLAIPDAERSPWFSVALDGMTVDGPTTFVRSSYSFKTISMFMQYHRENYNLDPSYIMHLSPLQTQLGYEHNKFDHKSALVAGAILFSMKRGAGTMVEMDQLEKAFVCMCCPSERRIRCTWLDLVEHFCESMDKYRAVISKNDDNLVPIIDTHALDGALSHELAMTVDETFVEGKCHPRYGHKHRDDQEGIYDCLLCARIMIYHHEYWMTCMKYHIRSMHGKEIEPGDYAFKERPKTPEWMKFDSDIDDVGYEEADGDVNLADDS